jgi:hypothetical protein
MHRAALHVSFNRWYNSPPKQDISHDNAIKTYTDRAIKTANTYKLKTHKGIEYYPSSMYTDPYLCAYSLFVVEHQAAKNVLKLALKGEKIETDPRIHALIKEFRIHNPGATVYKEYDKLYSN